MKSTAIFERRAYTLQPGRLEDFWEAQRTWNVGERAVSIIDNNLCYLTGAGRVPSEVVHLYRFDSAAHWREAYDRYYQEQLPDYFAQVRPWVLQQENELLGAAPLPGLTDCWLADKPRLPVDVPSEGPSHPTRFVVEELIDFRPGGLAAYWELLARFRAESPNLAMQGLLGVLVSMVGRLHRVYSYRCVTDPEEVHAHSLNLNLDDRWREIQRALEGLVVGGRTQLLTPSPLREQGSLFVQGGQARWQPTRRMDDDCDR